MQRTDLSLGSVVVASQDQVSSHLQEDVVILSLRSGEYHGLEGVGARVWELLEAPARVAEIRDALLDEYEVDSGRCEEDLLELLDSLLERGLIEIRDKAPATAANAG